jgi:hypothetical protein
MTDRYCGIKRSARPRSEIGHAGVIIRRTITRATAYVPTYDYIYMYSPVYYIYARIHADVDDASHVRSANFTLRFYAVRGRHFGGVLQGKAFIGNISSSSGKWCIAQFSMLAGLVIFSPCNESRGI